MPSSISNWVEQIRSGDVQALSRAITAVEDRTQESRPLLQALFPHAGRAHVVGLTGPPGVGKSTLADALTRHYRQRGLTVAIIAVDPSSPFSGGAILGDRIRMQSHAGDEGTYIRSMATRGALGGLASATADAVTVLDASGRDVVLIETVGTGQDETEIARLATVTVVVLAPGMGDEMQSMKAGMMEIADIFAVNKAEREGAIELERELRSMLALGGGRSGTRLPPIVRTVATSGKGVDELAEAIASAESLLATEEFGQRRRIEHWRARLKMMLRDEVLRRIEQEAMPDEQLTRLAEEIASGARDPYTLVDEMAAQLHVQSKWNTQEDKSSC